MLSRILVAGFIGGVILVECLLAYLLVPGPADLAQPPAAPAEEKKDEKKEEEKKDEGPKLAEVDLGTYGLSIHQPGEGTTLRVDFHLVGTVEEPNAAKLKELFERNKHRFRERILFEIRNSEVTDLTDPGLGLIKRRILEKSNALFGEPLLQAVVFSDYSFLEQ